MDTKFTPGPWASRKISVGDNVGYRFAVARGFDWSVCAISNRADDEECEANMRLICAAPDLLTAIEYGMIGPSSIILLHNVAGILREFARGHSNEGGLIAMADALSKKSDMEFAAYNKAVNP